MEHPDLHREMWARLKEFDGDDDKYEGMIERIVQETLNDAVLSNADKNHAPEDGETETTAQDAEDDTLDRLHKDHAAEKDEIDTLSYELQGGERMADTVKRGVLLKGWAPFPEVQKHVMNDSARQNSHAQMSRSGISS